MAPPPTATRPGLGPPPREGAGPAPGEVLPVLRALADPTRLAVFTALFTRERCVRDLADDLGHSQALISHHLRTLADAGLVRSRPWEGYRLYAVDPEAARAARDRLAAFLDPSRLAAVARPGGNPACCR